MLDTGPLRVQALGMVGPKVEQAGAAALPRHRVKVRGLPIKWPNCLSLRRNQLALIEGRDLLVVLDQVMDESAVPRHVHSLGWRPASLELSPTQRFVLLRSARGNYVEVRDLNQQRALTSIAGPETVVATFLNHMGDDLLAFSRFPGVVEGLSLPELGPVFRCESATPSPLIITGLCAVYGGTTLAAVAHRFSDPMDLLFSASIEHLVTLGPHASPALVESPVQALRVAVGPSGDDQVVVFQHGPERRGQTVEVPNRFTLRSASLDEAEITVPFPHPLPSGSALLATSELIVAASPDALDLIPYGNPALVPMKLAWRGLSFDPEGKRVALMPTRGFLDVLQLPG